MDSTAKTLLLVCAMVAASGAFVLPLAASLGGYDAAPGGAQPVIRLDLAEAGIVDGPHQTAEAQAGGRGQ